MPKGKDWLWVLVGVALAMFVLPYLSAKLSAKKSS
jgi:bacteriorhodopsin